MKLNNEELLVKYAPLASYMKKFKKKEDPILDYKKFTKAKTTLEKAALSGDVVAHNEMLSLGFYKDPEVNTHYKTEDNVGMWNFFQLAWNF